MATVQVRARLKDILEGMEFQSDEITAYLHRPTGRIIAISEEALQAAEEGTGEAGIEELELGDARGILEGADYRDRGYEAVARAWCDAHGIMVEPRAADA